MKRIALALAAVAAIGSVSAIATEASAQGRHNDRHDNGRWDRHDNGRHNGWDNRRGNDNRRYNNNWDRGRHNGYYLNQRFYYGPPPAAYYGRPDFRPGYQRWARGQYLPQYYWGNQYVVYDYNRYHLRAPPRGYRWYNVNGDFVLAAIAGGLIAEALFN